MGQVVIWNPGWRRSAFVSNCDCIRLESAMRTPIEELAVSKLIRPISPCIDHRFDEAIVWREKCDPQGRTSQKLNSMVEMGIEISYFERTVTSLCDC